MSFEIITTTDKTKRDQMFQDLRQNGNELERQVVKFSGNESVVSKEGFQEAKIVGLCRGNPHKPIWRFIYRSTWSLAYPTS